MSAVADQRLMESRNATQVNGFFLTLLSVYLLFVFIRPQDYPALGIEYPILPTIEVLVFLSWLACRPKLSSPQHLCMFVLMLWIPFSLLVTGSELLVDTTQYFLFSIFLTFMFVATASREQATLDRLGFVLAFSTTLIATHCIDQYFFGNGIGWSGQAWLERKEAFGVLHQVRYVGIFADPNDTGMILVQSIPFLFLYRAQAKQTIARVAYSGAIALHFLAIYLTNSRGTYLALAASLATWLALKYNMTRALIAGAILGPFILILGPARLSVSGDQSTQDRIDAWYQGFQLFSWKPIFGIGMNHFKDHHHKAAHNSWVQLLSETGLLGYVSWSALLFSSLYLAYALQQPNRWGGTAAEADSEEYVLRAKTILISLVGCMTAMFFLSRAYHLPAYFLCAMVAGQYMNYRDSVQPITATLFSVLIGGVLPILTLYIVVRMHT
ncbi:MAG: O-antigen ligase family protein [Pseudomonadota bacterium]